MATIYVMYSKTLAQSQLKPWPLEGACFVKTAFF